MLGSLLSGVCSRNIPQKVRFKLHGIGAHSPRAWGSRSSTFNRPETRSFKFAKRSRAGWRFNAK